MNNKFYDALQTSTSVPELARRMYPTGPKIDLARARFGSRGDWERSDVQYLAAELLLYERAPEGSTNEDLFGTHVFGTAIAMVGAANRFGASERAARMILLGIWQVGMYLLHESNIPLSKQMRRALSSVVQKTEWVARMVVDSPAGLDQ